MALRIPRSSTAAQGEDAPSQGSHFSYKPALDGIRAVAVIAVLAYHGGLPWAHGGFLGVDAFFVLSGYLITSLLLGEWQTRDNIGLLAFWSRRARRLLPALFLMLGGVAVYAIVYAKPDELARIRGDALATIAYVANWRPIFAGQSYFDQFSLPSPLRHTWSLGIEEQFYILWPLLLLAVLRFRRASLSTLLAVTLAAVAASALLMALLFHPGSDPSRVYYGTDTRAQSLLTGAALAMLLLRLGPLRGTVSRWGLQLLGLSAALLVGFLWAVISENDAFLYRGGFLILAVAVAAVIAAAVQPKAGPLGRLLSLPPLRLLGLISYGVYLWHWPIYVIMTPTRTGWYGYNLFAARVLATLAMAIGSYLLVEMPVRRGAFKRWKVSWSLAPATAACLAVAVIFVTRGAISPGAALSEENQAMPTANATAGAAEPVRVMVMGDSVGVTLEVGIEQVAPEMGLSMWGRANAGCGFLPVDGGPPGQDGLAQTRADLCLARNEAWPSEVDSFQPDVVVWLFGAWDSIDIVVNGQTLMSGNPEWQAYVSDELEKELAVMTAHGAKLMLLTFPCTKSALLNDFADPKKAELERLQQVNNLNDVYRRFAQQHTDKVVLEDLNGFVCPEGRFTDLAIDGVKLRQDGVHFTPDGATIVARWLAPEIVRVGNAGQP